MELQLRNLKWVIVFESQTEANRVKDILEDLLKESNYAKKDIHPTPTPK